MTIVSSKPISPAYHRPGRLPLAVGERTKRRPIQSYKVTFKGVRAPDCGNASSFDVTECQKLAKNERVELRGMVRCV